MLNIRVVRDPRSLHPKRRPDKPDGWGNNDAANSLDSIEIYDGLARIFSCSAQTVANLPGARFKDTVAPGAFQLRAFVDPRSFYGRVHGICNTLDIEGQIIDTKSIQPYPIAPLGVAGQNGQTFAPCSEDRYLCHDTQRPWPASPNLITRVAWSAGCFVVEPVSLTHIGFIFDSRGIKAGDLIPGELVMKAA